MIQQKYNLMREETQGFAKLVEIVCNKDSKATYDMVLGLIGGFSLDPNRVIDVLLNNEKWTEQIVPHFNNEKLQHIFMLKLKQVCESKEYVSDRSIFRVALTLLNHSIISFDQLLASIHPHNQMESFQTAHKVPPKWEITSVRKSLPLPYRSMEARAMCSFQIFCLTDDAINAVCPESTCPIIGFLISLLETGSITHAQKIFEAYGSYPLASDPRVAKAIANLIKYLSWEIDSAIHKKLFFEPLAPISISCDQPQVAPGDWKDLIERVYPLVKLLGPYIFYDPKLYIRVLRQLSNIPSGPEKNPTVIDMMKVVILPGLSMSQANAHFANDVWSILSNLGDARFQLYHSWVESYDVHPPLQLVKAHLGSCLSVISGFVLLLLKKKKRKRKKEKADR